MRHWNSSSIVPDMESSELSSCHPFIFIGDPKVHIRTGQDRRATRLWARSMCRREEKRSRRRTKERSRQRKQWYGNRDIAIISSSYASFTVLIEEMTFDNVCIVCSSHFNSSRTTSNRSIREKIKRFTRTVIPRQNEQRDRLSLIMEEKFGSDQFVHRNKIAYLSLRSVEKRKQMITLIKKIEKQKIQIAELFITRKRKLAALRASEEERQDRQREIVSQRAIYESILLNNESFLFQMLHTARCRAVLATFLKFQIITQTPPRSKSGIILSGCSSILGLPLLNSGDCTDIPPEIVCAAVSHICHLVDALAAILNIRLPHPARPFEALQYALISPHGNLTRHVALTPAFLSIPLVDTDSPQQRRRTSSADTAHFSDDLLSVLHSRAAASARRASAKVKYKFEPRGRSKRSAAALAKNPSSNTHPCFPPDGEADVAAEWVPNSEFSFGLSLLQADVLALCMKAGKLQPAELWPPEALLLNLSVLHSRCVDIITGRFPDGGQINLGRWLQLGNDMQKIQGGVSSDGSDPSPDMSALRSLFVSEEEVSLFRSRYAKHFGRRPDSPVGSLEDGFVWGGRSSDDDDDYAYDSSGAIQVPQQEGVVELTTPISTMVSPNMPKKQEHFIYGEESSFRGALWKVVTNEDDDDWSILETDYM